jgi:uncharacterized membrane protein YbhN (UPF0104 family)
LLWIVRLVITGGAFALVSRSIRLEELLERLRHVAPLAFAGVLVAALVPLFFLGVRWWILLRANAFDVSLPRALLVSYAGAFFNNFLPGAVGGDIAKILLLAPGESRRAALAGTVILDRVVGLVVLMCVAAACISPFLGRFLDPSLGYLVWGGLGLLVLAVAAFSSPRLQPLLARLPFGIPLLQIREVFRSLRGRGEILAGVLVCSVATQLALVGLALAVSRAIGMQGTEAWMFFAFVPTALLAAGLPISIGGWGVQEFVYAELFGRIGGVDPSQAVALSVVFKLAQLLASAPGGLLYLFGALGRNGAR